MRLKRTTFIVVGGVATAAWLYAAITPQRPSAVLPPIARAPIDASGAALAGEIARLRERLRPDPAPSQPTRNPFVFRSAPAPASREGAAVLPDASMAAGNARAAFGLSLVGIAEDAGPDGPVRTAIISGNGQLFLVQEGATVSDRGAVYRVATVAADGVELKAVEGDAVRHLVLN